MIRNKKTIAAASLSLACTAVLGYWVASPYLAISEIRNGFEGGDSDKIVSHVDFSAVRDDLKAQLPGFIARQMQADPEMASNPFAGIASVFIVPMANSMIDTYVTPGGIRQLLDTTSKDQGSISAKSEITTDTPQAENPAYQLGSALGSAINPRSNASLGYDGLNKFILTSKTSDNKDLRLVFNRLGFAEWKLVSIQLPPQ